jgi:hypothetical protein
MFGQLKTQQPMGITQVAVLSTTRQPAAGTCGRPDSDEISMSTPGVHYRHNLLVEQEKRQELTAKCQPMEFARFPAFFTCLELITSQLLLTLRFWASRPRDKPTAASFHSFISGNIGSRTGRCGRSRRNTVPKGARFGGLGIRK